MRTLGWISLQFAELKNKQLVVVFLIYVASMFVFGGIYFNLFKSQTGVYEKYAVMSDTGEKGEEGDSDAFQENPAPEPYFAFESDIARSRNQAIRASLQAQCQRLQAARTVLTKLRQDLDSVPSPPPLSSYGPADYIDFNVDGFTCKFSLRPGVGDAKSLYRSKSLIVSVSRDPSMSLFKYGATITGPSGSSQPPYPGPLKEWMETTARGRDIKLYRETNKRAIAELEREIKSCEGELYSVTDYTQRYWSFWDFFYFSAITQTTVGYGDILPNSTTVRMLVVVQVMWGLILAGFALNFSIRSK